MRFSLLLLFFSSLAADPWGKDADLLQAPPAPKQNSFSLAKVLIEFHQDVISPADGPRSHFIPSSSEYTKQAMQKHGFFKGFILGCDRLLRENKEEWVYKKILDPAGFSIKYDPVP